MTVAELSRYRVHKMKVRYWRNRQKIARLNEMIREMEARYGTRQEAEQREAFRRLMFFRKHLSGWLRGIEDAFKQFDLKLDMAEAPVVRDEDLKQVGSDDADEDAE